MFNSIYFHQLTLFIVIYVVASAKLDKLLSVRKTENVKLPPVPPPKLLILLLDGFRWDYYNIHKSHLPGFRQLLETGIQAEYVHPIFPSQSLPSWTTITTGLYPENHNILENVMLHRSPENPDLLFNFKDNSSKLEYWWKWAEPLWITATKKGLKVYLANWARCDVPFKGLLPAECTGYREDDVGIFQLREKLAKAIERFEEGYSLAMIYHPDLDDAGHKHGPGSGQLLDALIAVDVALQEFMFNLELVGLEKQVNIVITSDHGMTSVRKEDGMVYVKLEDYITDMDDIYKVIGKGAVVMIAVKKGKVDLVFQQVSKMPGVDAYKKEDIPEELHFKGGKHVQDILLVARPFNFIVGLVKNEGKQVPKEEILKVCLGQHGYFNVTDMRSIFFAKGPAFKKGFVHEPIRLEDEYQIFTHILGLPSQENNGTWKSVKDMFTE